MALIELNLAPAWKRVVTTDEETETTAETASTETAETGSTEPRTVDIVEEEEEAPTGGKRRLLTFRRLFVLGLLVGAVVGLRRLRRMRSEMGGEEPTIDVEAPDERSTEQ